VQFLVLYKSSNTKKSNSKEIFTKMTLPEICKISVRRWFLGWVCAVDARVVSMQTIAINRVSN
jgi:hypothetical protein